MLLGVMVMCVCVLQGQATISNDGATILKQLDIVHPAAKTLVDIAKSQDAEVRQHLFHFQLCFSLLCYLVFSPFR